MNRIILALFLVLAGFALADEFAEVQDSQEPVESETFQDLEQPSESEPERTPEGYRIIRIDPQQTVRRGSEGKVIDSVGQALDSVAKAKAEEEYLSRPVVPFHFSLGVSAKVTSRTLGATNSYGNDFDLLDCHSLQFGLMALIPLYENSFALRVGAFYESTTLNNVEEFKFSNGMGVYARSEIEDNRISIPALIAFKGDRSGLIFELGAQLSWPISSVLKDQYFMYEIQDVDLLDVGYRKSMDFNFLLGLGFLLGERFTLEGLFGVGTGFFENDAIPGVEKAADISFLIGLTFNFI